MPDEDGLKLLQQLRSQGLEIPVLILTARDSVTNRFEPWLAQPPARILDLCTGSGCIGIACAYEFQDAEVVLGDLSFEALEVANQNIERHGVDERVYTVQGDGFDGLPGQRFDLIVSNPPYVDAEDFADVPDEYQHEPELGLACGDDGLNLVRRMLAEAEGLLLLDETWPTYMQGRWSIKTLEHGTGGLSQPADENRAGAAVHRSACLL